MSLDALGGLLEAAPEYQNLHRLLAPERAGARVQVLAQAAPFVLATLRKGLRTPMLVIAPRPEEARRLHEQLAIWSGDDRRVLHFPETESLPFERLVADIETTQQRLSTLSALLDTEGPPPVVVASASAVAQKTIDRLAFSFSSHTLRRGQRLDMEGDARPVAAYGLCLRVCRRPARRSQPTWWDRRHLPGWLRLAGAHRALGR